MKQTLINTKEFAITDNFFSQTVMTIVSNLETLINSEDAPLPDEAAKKILKMWKTLKELVISQKLINNTLLSSKKLSKISQLSKDLLDTKYKDFFNEQKYKQLEIIHLISLYGGQILEGLGLLTKPTKGEKDYEYIKNIATGLNLLSKALRKCPFFINVESYKYLKELMENLINVFKKSENTAPGFTVYKKYEELAYLSCVSILYLVEQFEKTIESTQRDKPKFKKLSPMEQKEFMESLIEIDEDTKYSPEEEREYEKMLERLSIS